MSKTAVLEKIEQSQVKKRIPNFKVGDTISVHFRIIEGNKERTQVFTGTVIARKGSGATETVFLHRVAYGEGMERMFILHSPRVSKIELAKKGKVRRSKLYYLRGKTGKKARVKGQVAATWVDNVIEEDKAEPAVEEVKAEEPKAKEKEGES